MSPLAEPLQPQAGLARNPFSERIVRDPETRPAVSVVSYNQKVFETLVARMRSRTEARNNEVRASVLVSNRPGFGKTHLLSRILDAVMPFAFPIFIPPLNDTEGMMRGVLNRVVARLWRMTVAERPINQFEWLGLQLIALGCRNDPQAAQAWATMSIEWLNRPEMQEYLRAERRRLQNALAGAIEGANPYEPALHWAMALLDILSVDLVVETRAVSWIRGHISHPEQDPMGEGNTLPSDEIARAERRLADLQRIFALVKPLIFVFDQVENFFVFGPGAIGSLAHTIERLLTECPSSQVIISANSPDWSNFSAAFEAQSQAFPDRLDPPLWMTGLTADQGIELRDLRIGDLGAEARKRIPDAWIRDQTKLEHEITPRQFLERCEAMWEGRDPVPPSPTVVAPVRIPSLEREWAKAQMDAAREPLGFFADSIRTVLIEVLEGTPARRDQYEFVRFAPGDLTVIVEESPHAMRWQALCDRARQIGAAADVRGLRPDQALRTAQHLDYVPIPGKGWNAQHPLRLILSDGGKLLEMGPERMRDVLAMNRFLNGSEDFGANRKDAADWLRERLAPDWMQWLSGNPPPTQPDVVPPVPAPALQALEITVSDLICRIVKPDDPLQPKLDATARRRGAMFHDVARRFVGHLVERDRTDIGVTEQLKEFMAHDRLWRERGAALDEGQPSLTAALGVFAEQIERLRTDAVKSWNELYIATELQLQQQLGSYNGVAIIVKGRCDVLRRRKPGGPPEIVDYKLSSSCGSRAENLIQLVLYAQLLSEGANPLRCGGCLEIYAPRLTELKHTHDELRQLFFTDIEPVLRDLANDAAKSQPPRGSIVIDTREGAEPPSAADREEAAEDPLLQAGPLPTAIDAAFAGYVGNQPVVDRLVTALTAACQERNPPVLPHNFLFTGAGGLGKTELAKRVARALNLPFLELQGSRLRNVDDLLRLIDAQLEHEGVDAREQGVDSGLPVYEYPPLVILVDEIHELGRRADQFLSLFEPRQRRAMGSRKVGDFAHATLLGATTDAGLLPAPFLTRFRHYALEPYTADEIAQILEGIPIGGDPAFRRGLAVLARLNPRTAKHLATEFMEHHRVHGYPLDGTGLAQMRAVLQADEAGLTPQDYSYLRCLLNGPRGLTQLSNSIRVDSGRIARDMEPYLAQLGLIAIGRAGRELLPAGRAKLNDAAHTPASPKRD